MTTEAQATRRVVIIAAEDDRELSNHLARLIVVAHGATVIEATGDYDNTMFEVIGHEVETAWRVIAILSPAFAANDGLAQLAQKALNVQKQTGDRLIIPVLTTPTIEVTQLTMGAFDLTASGTRRDRAVTRLIEAVGQDARLF